MKLDESNYLKSLTENEAAVLNWQIPPPPPTPTPPRGNGLVSQSARLTLDQNGATVWEFDIVSPEPVN